RARLLVARGCARDYNHELDESRRTCRESRIYMKSAPEQQKLVTVVIPAHNEAAAIGDVISRIPKTIERMQVVVIVVDDGSTDDTAQIARVFGAQVLRHVTNLGAGAATVTGLKAAQALNADVIVTIDADGQHDPEEIERLVQCLLEGPFDVVIGSRILSPQGMPLTRFMANLL